MIHKRHAISSQSHFIRQKAVQSLVGFYHRQWPCEEDLIVDKLTRIRELLHNESLFQSVLAQFKKHISGEAGRHPSRYSKKSFAIGIDWVYETKEFQELVNLLDDFTQQEEKSSQSLMSILMEQSVNLVSYVADHPVQTILFLLMVQAILPTNAVTAEDTHDNLDPRLLDSCSRPALRNPFYQPKICNTLVRKGDFSGYADSSIPKPPVVIFGERHDAPEVCNMFNRLFPTLLQQGYRNFAQEMYSGIPLDSLIARSRAQSMPGNKERAELFQSVIREKVNYFPLENDADLIEILSRRKNRADMIQYITDLTDHRDQVAAQKIIKIIADTNRGVFVLFGAAHSGIALYLSQAGYPVIFIAAPEEPSLLNDFHFNLLNEERKRTQRTYPDFKYIAVPRSTEPQYAITEEIMQLITGSPQNNAAQLALFWEKYRKGDYYGSSTLPTSKPQPPSWKMIAEDAKYERRFGFFDSKSKVILQELNILGLNDECLEETPKEFCDAWSKLQ